MKNTVAGLTFLLVLSLSPFMGPASADTFPNLVGAWQGTYRTLVYHDDATHTGEAKMVLTISRQEDEFVFASHEWELHEDNPGRPDLAGEGVRGGDETLVGIVDFNGENVTLLETHDNGVFELDVVGQNVMQGIYREQGHHEATIFRVRLTRQE